MLALRQHYQAIQPTSRCAEVNYDRRAHSLWDVTDEADGDGGATEDEEAALSACVTAATLTGELAATDAGRAASGGIGGALGRGADGCGLACCARRAMTRALVRVGVSV